MYELDETDMKVEIPGGYLVCLATGGSDDYPGVGVFFSKDGKTVDWDNLVSITEYNSTFDNIQIIGYQKGEEDYVARIRFEDGEILGER